MELKIEHLSKRFKDKTAVDDVSLTLTSGVWGLLGANGAGKTTLMRMIADIMVPTNGAIYYDGQDIHEMGKAYRELFGFLPQDFGYSRDFTVKDYLEYMAALKDVPARETSRKINHLLDILTLSDVKSFISLLIRPSYPLYMPLTFHPLKMAALVTALMAAFIPGASPPDVRIPIVEIFAI